MIVHVNYTVNTDTLGTRDAQVHMKDVFTSSPPGQNSSHFADDIFRCLFVNENFRFLIKISLRFVPKGPIDNNPALV